jgi:hypothetical protein
MADKSNQTASGSTTSPRAGDLLQHYRSMLRGRPPVDLGGGLESTMEAGEPDLSDPGITERVESARADLQRIIKDYLGDEPRLHDIAEKMLAEGGEALRYLAADDPRLLHRPDLLSGLEAIVRTDGRPSFMIRNGEVDQSSSPIGTWADVLFSSEDLLRRAVSCVGRIDIGDSSHKGTGFLIQKNLILTNRHVLQVIADRTPDGEWRFKPGAQIDFGREFKARESVDPRALRSVVFAGSKPISLFGAVDHSKLDLALIELEPAPAAAAPTAVLAVQASADWATPTQTVFTVGYPASPRENTYEPSLLEQLFQSTYGCKRLAPGLIMQAQASSLAWTLGHDATTLGGNSGSVVLVAGKESLAAGLHYGGRTSEPRENWGHVLGRVLDETDGRGSTTLREHLQKFGVSLVAPQSGVHV